MTTTGLDRQAHGCAGIGLRLPHIAEVVATRPVTGWLEVHPENFLANPHGTELLLELAGHYPISVHTVGVSIGSAGGIDRTHLERVRGLVDLIDPFLVSGHLAWSTHEGEFLNDLLPLPYDKQTLQLVANHIDEVQEGLGRSYLIENPSSYLGVATSTMTETEFFCELTRRTGCKLLCDVSNVYLSGHNLGYDPFSYINEMPAGAIGEIHLGGFTSETDASNPGGHVLIDTHDRRIAEPAWELYAYAVRRFGQKPTLVEWDSDLPELALLLSEAAKADQIAGAALSQDRCHAVA